MYEYKCVLDRVVDGDTVDLIIDLGFKVALAERFRLFGINAPESRTRDLKEKKRGLAATTWLKNQIALSSEMKIETVKGKKGKYGRWLGTLWLKDSSTGVWLNVNQLMVDVGHAVLTEY